MTNDVHRKVEGRATIRWLLREAKQLHEAALDPARWPEVVRAARTRGNIQRATGLLSENERLWLESTIENASQICAEVARLELARAVTSSAVDALSLGIVVLDFKGRVLRANTEGERLLGVSPLSAADAANSRYAAETWLQRLADRVSSLAVGESIVEVGQFDDSRRLEALAIRLGTPSDPFALPNGRTLIFLTDPDGATALDESAIVAAFALTPAEARLSACLLRGDTVQEAAQALGVKTTTVRTQLASIFRKTNTSRQPELMRLLITFAETRR